MLKRAVFLALTATLLITIPDVHPQDEVETDGDNAGEEDELTEEEIESIIFEPMVGKTYLGSQYLSALEMKSRIKSPTGAMFRSLVIPGWGQFHNGAWWKAPIFITGEAITLIYAIKNYRTARDFYNRSLSAENGDSEKLYEEYEKHLRRTEMWGWLFTGVVVFSMLDAYVDAHLSNYDVSPLEELEVSPYVEEKEVGIMFSRDF